MLDLVVHDQRNPAMAALAAPADRKRRRRDELMGLEDEAEALELVQGAVARVGGRVRHEAQTQPRAAHALDRFQSAGDRLLPDVQDAIEVEEQCPDVREHRLSGGATSGVCYV